MKKICYIVPSLRRGGAESFLAALAARMAATGVEVLVHSLQKSGSTPLPLAAPVRFSEGRSGRSLDSASILSAIRNIRDFGPDLIHCKGNDADFFAALTSRLLPRKPWVSTIESVHQLLVHPSLKRRVKNILIKRAYRHHFRGIVFVSAATGKTFTDWVGGPLPSPTVIYNGVDPRRFSKGTTGEKDQIRLELGLPASACLILTVGRMIEVKGQRFLLEALATLGNQDQMVHLAIAGRGPLGSALLAEASALGIKEQVHFLGERADIERVYHAADIFALPSLSEGHPLTLIEAMASGLPCVASAVGGIPEVLEEDGAGVLVEPQSVSGLAAALRRLIREPESRRYLGAKAEQIARDRFSLGISADRHLAFYRNLTTIDGESHQ